MPLIQKIEKRMRKNGIPEYSEEVKELIIKSREINITNAIRMLKQTLYKPNFYLANYNYEEK